MSRIRLAVAAAAVAAGLTLGTAGPARGGYLTQNVIIMVADGAGANTYAATNYWTGMSSLQQGPAWYKTWASTYPLRFGNTPIAGPAGLAQNPNTVYNPARNYDATPVGTTTGGYPDRFAGCQWNKTTYPDSANTIAAVMTGQKTYNNAVNVNGNGTPLKTFAELASVDRGKAAGVVSTVQFADATPSVGGGAHNVSRANRTAIANQMLTAGVLDVVVGTGNPDYDNNGNLRANPNYSWISQADWTKLTDADPTNNPGGFRLIQDRAAFQALVTDPNAAGQKVLGVPKSFDGTQAYRGPNGLTASTDNAFTTPSGPTCRPSPR
ncbi:MAG: alkaline phosphatase [Gemmataceae bacterium]|nr:alkaline phosphatase [Gemmataceae bacterium]